MRLHFIAIGGSIMHQLAIAMQRKGHLVSGSDDAIFEPAKSNLERNNLLPDKTGWFPEIITNKLDGIILGMHAKKNNPELLKAQASGIPVWSYPEFLYRHAANKRRIVIAGSHGKTTITSMVMHVLKYWGCKFDYVVGAKIPGFEESVSLTEEAPIIVIEGDEYLASAIDLKPKFLYYRPHTALISGIAWDHINVFPVYNEYVEQFRLLVDSIVDGGDLVYFAGDKEVESIALKVKHANKYPYTTPDYFTDQNEIWQVIRNGKEYPIQIFGEHNLQNLIGAKMVCELADNISETQFFEAIQSFTGASKRLEIVANSKKCTVYKDFAHAPSKVTATTKAVKAMHPHRKLIACLELHTYSSLNTDFLPFYANTLQPAEKAVVFYDPEALAIKNLPPVSDSFIFNCFKHPNLIVFNTPQDMQNYLMSLDFENTDLLLMSSGNFGGINLNSIAIFATE